MSSTKNTETINSSFKQLDDTVKPLILATLNFGV